MPKLLDQVRLTLRARHYSIRTEQSYVSWIRDFILFHRKRRPRELGEQHISSWLSHLATDRRVAASTQNQAFSPIEPDLRLPDDPDVESGDETFHPGRPLLGTLRYIYAETREFILSSYELAV